MLLILSWQFLVKSRLKPAFQRRCFAIPGEEQAEACTPEEVGIGVFMGGEVELLIIGIRLYIRTIVCVSMRWSTNAEIEYFRGGDYEDKEHCFCIDPFNPGISCLRCSGYDESTRGLRTGCNGGAGNSRARW